MNKKAVAGIIIATIAILGIVVYLSTDNAPKKDYSAFAQCVKDSGATFYGAFWCPHCQAQKAMFNAAAVEKLPYVECSTPDGNSQTPACVAAKIESYPTWVFKGGATTTGVIELPVLASTTGCVLPQ